MDGAARTAAYSELIAGLLDVRDPRATKNFDDALRELVGAGRLDVTDAAELRWLQRESVQAVVDHARTALPAALIGLEEARAEPTTTSETSHRTLAEPLVRYTPPMPPPTREEPAEISLIDEPDDDETPAPDDAKTRRLLVAGLTSLSGSVSDA